jgi:hypothetical protein
VTDFINKNISRPVIPSVSSQVTPTHSVSFFQSVSGFKLMILFVHSLNIRLLFFEK